MSDESDPKLTAERLRSWLNTEQSSRELMCLALLPSLGPFTDCTPRRPRGGRDGARDIEATFKNSIRVWGAVGFKNDASSSYAHRAWAQKKFRSDLDTAIKENPNLEGFLFFTNVDLTPDNKKDLIQYALKDKQQKVAEVFDFERLRHALDSAEGLIVRFQYLRIPMSSTEQATLFDRYGNQIQRAIQTRFDSFERILERIEFITAAQLPVREVELTAYLNAFILKADVASGAVMLCLEPPYTNSDMIVLLCQTNNDYPGENLTTESKLWVSSNPSNFLQCGRSLFGSRTDQYSGNFKFNIRSNLLPTSLNDFLHHRIGIYCNEALRSYVVKIRCTINGFVLCDMEAPREDYYQIPISINWGGHNIAGLTDQKWFSLNRGPWSVNVMRQTLPFDHY